MNSCLPLVLATITVCVSVGRAAQPDLTKLPPPSTLEDVTYAKNIRPIFEATCFRCHGEERQKGDLRLDSLPAVLKGSEHGAVIVPGKSAESKLVLAVARLDEKTAMPPRPRSGGPGGPGGPGGGPGGKRPQDGSKPPSRPPGAGGAGGAGGGTSAKGPGAGGAGGGGGQGNRPGPGFKAVTAQQVGLIRAWIDQGAK